MKYRINYSKVISQADSIAGDASELSAHSTFLTQAAESYEAAEREGTQKAQEQGKVF